jgi:hypothetical protein
LDCLASDNSITINKTLDIQVKVDVAQIWKHSDNLPQSKSIVKEAGRFERV